MPETKNTILLKRQLSDLSFQENVPESYDLFIYAGPEELSCAVAERRSKKFVALESLELQSEDWSDSSLFEQIKSGSKLLSLKGYPRIICCSGLGNATLVPNALFESSSAKDHFLFSSKDKDDGYLLVDHLYQMDASNIFTVPGILYQKLSSWFDMIEFHHTSTSQIEFLLTINKNLQEELVTVNIHKQFIEITVTKGRQLLLFNNFSYDTAEELVYYILFVYEQLHLNPDHVKIQLAGEIETTDEIFTLCMKYIRHVSLLSKPDGFSTAPVFNSLPSQFHFNLFSQIICAS